MLSSVNQYFVNNMKYTNRKTVFGFLVLYLCALKMWLNRLLITLKRTKGVRHNTIQSFFSIVSTLWNSLWICGERNKKHLAYNQWEIWKKLWMYPRSPHSTDGFRTKERRQCDNSTPRKDGQGRVPVGNQKRLLGHCRGCGLCETGLPRERTDH